MASITETFASHFAAAAWQEGEISVAAASWEGAEVFIRFGHIRFIQLLGTSMKSRMKARTFVVVKVDRG